MTNTDNEKEKITILHDQTKREKQAVIADPEYFRKPINVIRSLNETKKVSKIPELSKPIRKCLKKQFKTLFPIQYNVIPYLINTNISLLRPRDVCICAPTGCGKTLSYVIPILQILSENQAKAKQGLKAIVILPVRDLAIQVFKVFQSLAESAGVSCALTAGFENLNQEKVGLIDNNTNSIKNVLVCTPGRLIDHIRNTKELKLNELSLLILDEADMILKEHKHDWYSTLVSHIPNYDDKYSWTESASDRVIRKILLSATLTRNPQQIKRFNLHYPQLFQIEASGVIESTNEPMEVDETEKTSTNQINNCLAPEGLKEYYVVIDKEYTRPLFIVDLILRRKLSGILCFCNSRTNGQRLSALLKSFNGINCEYLGCDLSPKARMKLRQKLEDGKINILVTLDSMGRGIDLGPRIEAVVQYSLPHEMEAYVHRVGRTARAGRSGLSYALCSKKQVFHLIKDINKMGHKIKRHSFHETRCYRYMDKYNKIVKQLTENGIVEVENVE